MAEDRLVAMGTEGTARFLVSNATLVREPGDRLSCRLLCRLEILSAEGRPAAFVEAEARRTRTLSDRATMPARLRATEELVRGAMEELNVEFEFQIRRTLRAWLVEGAAPPIAPSGAPAGGETIQREDLPRG